MHVDKPVFQSLLMMLSRWALNKHDHIVTMGEDMSAIMRRDGVKADKLLVIPNWPDVKATMLDKSKPLRHDSQNPFVLEGVFTVLYSGNFGYVHDFTSLIGAMEIVQDTTHAIRFILAGDGFKFDQVREKVDGLFLTNVHFVRAQPKEKFIDLLLAGDVHVSTLTPEALGLAAPSKINSALGLARPCLYIGPANSFQAQLISSYKAGVVIDPTDPQARYRLAEAIIHLANDRSAYESMQRNALQAAESIAFPKALAAFEALCALEPKDA
jgi:glycosyltransferase involved in cell wall biosynthesis